MNYAFHTTADLYDWALEALAPTAAVNTETPATQLPLRWCTEADTVGLYARDPLVVLAETDSSTLETASKPRWIPSPLRCRPARCWGG